MNLAKWLAISGTVKQVGGQNRFVLPPVYRERAGFKYSNNSNSLTVLSENADVKKIEKEQPQAGQKNETASLNYSGEIKLATTKSDSTRALSAENDFSEPDFQKPTPVVNLPREKEDRLFASPATENKSANPAGESQLTLDDWKENSQRLERQTVSAQRSYYSVGRWALKRVMPGKIPNRRRFRENLDSKKLRLLEMTLTFQMLK
jgi:hypothetical protein